MDNKFVSRDTLRKRKARKNETPSQHETRLARQRENNQRKRGREDAEEREARLSRDNERKRAKLAMETDEQREKRLNDSRKRRTYLNNLGRNQDQDLNPQQLPQQNSGQAHSGTGTRDKPLPADELSGFERDLLKKFRSKVDKLKHTLCPTCNESFPSITLVKGECRRCHAEKASPKKFSAENNMDPGEVPDELQDLTEVEEMLIARVFPVMSVYRLRGGQHGYRGNVINFPQDVQELAKKLPRHPSSLDVLVIRRQSASNSEAFRDFRVRRSKVVHALSWLKENNRYYADIIIDYEVL